jgi:hypothetical protein
MSSDDENSDTAPDTENYCKVPYDVKWNSMTLPPAESLAAGQIQTLLSLLGLPKNGNKVVLYDRMLGYLLYREEKYPLQFSVDTGQLLKAEPENTGDANEDLDTTNETSTEEAVWVQCDSCSKWRSLPSHIKPEELPDEWKCSMNIWDGNHDDCNKEEEQQPDDSDENIGDEDAALEEEEQGNGLSAEYKASILQKYKDSLEEEKRIKRKRVEDKVALEEKRKLAKIEREDNEVEMYVSKLSAEEIAEAKAAAIKRDKKGQIPIHKYCAMHADEHACKLLRRDIYFGANVMAEDVNERTPLHFAYMNNCPNYARMLIRFGAEESCDVTSAMPSEYNIFMNLSSKPVKKDPWGIDKFI